MWTHPLTIAIVTGLVAGFGSAILTTWLQHHFWKIQREEERRFWKLQRRDEICLEAIREYNRLTNAYVAACLSQTGPRPPEGEWLRDLNTTAATIRVLFSDGAYRAAMDINRMITPYASWTGPDRTQRAHQFSEICHAALTALYGEVTE